MKVVAVANRKGGVGKSTIAGHLAVAAAAAGERVVLMDTDPQGSLASWWNARNANDVQFAHAELVELPDQFRALAERGFTLAIIDTPPAVTTTIAAVVDAADLVVVPTRPSPHDLRAVGATVELCRLRPVFVLNGAAYRARITAQAAVELSFHGVVAPVILHQRTDFAGSMTDGRTIQEIDPRGKGAAEIAALWSFVSKLLHTNKEQP